MSGSEKIESILTQIPVMCISLTGGPNKCPPQSGSCQQGFASASWLCFHWRCVGFSPKLSSIISLMVSVMF